MTIYTLSDRLKAVICLSERFGGPKFCFEMMKMCSSDTKKLFVGTNVLKQIFAKGPDALLVAKDIMNRVGNEPPPVTYAAPLSCATPSAKIPLNTGTLARDKKALEIGIFANAVFISITTTKDGRAQPELTLSLKYDEFAKLITYETAMLDELGELFKAARKRKHAEMSADTNPLPTATQHSWLAVNADSGKVTTHDKFTFSKKQCLATCKQLLASPNWRVHQLTKQVPIPACHAIIMAVHTALIIGDREKTAVDEAMTKQCPPSYEGDPPCPPPQDRGQDAATLPPEGSSPVSSSPPDLCIEDHNDHGMTNGDLGDNLKCMSFEGTDDMEENSIMHMKLLQSAEAEFRKIHTDVNPLKIMNVAFRMADEMGVSKSGLTPVHPTIAEILMVMQIATKCSVTEFNLDFASIPSPELVDLALYCIKQ